jgi:hypothetical protein
VDFSSTHQHFIGSGSSGNKALLWAVLEAAMDIWMPLEYITLDRKIHIDHTAKRFAAKCIAFSGRMRFPSDSFAWP